MAAWKAAKPPAERLEQNGSDTALGAHMHVPQLAAAAFPGAAAVARFFVQGARAEGGSIEVDGMPQTPMLDKMKAVKKWSQAIGEFLDWLQSRGYILCRRAEGEQPHVPYMPAVVSVETLLAEYFEVDLEAAERERRAVLEYVRQQQ